MNIETLEKLKTYAETLPDNGYSYIDPAQLKQLVSLALDAARHRERIGAHRGMDAVEALAPAVPKNVTHLRRVSDIKIDGEILELK
jgi:hypothetical protein